MSVSLSRSRAGSQAAAAQGEGKAKAGRRGKERGARDGGGNGGDGAGALAAGGGRRCSSCSSSGSGGSSGQRRPLDGGGGGGGGASGVQTKRKSVGIGTQGAAATQRKGVEWTRGWASVAQDCGGEGGGTDGGVRWPAILSAAFQAGAGGVRVMANEPSPAVVRAGAGAARRGIEQPSSQGEGEA